MKCKVDEQMLLQWFLGELSETERQRLQNHIDFCEHCTERIAELYQFQHAWNDECEQPPDVFVDNVMSQIVRKRKVKVLDVLHYLTAAAATFLLVYLGGFEQMLGSLEVMPERIYETNDSIHQATEAGLGLIKGINYYITGYIEQLKVY
ncbi:anti-sigma factor family protein [Desulfuribacillus alkaliarsenatis]|uniref:Anti-sigma-W factor RsiW n=1 Tax=Desulfuribacillus alkaliarsenatis TaxID=766136 RepID=A0A1E5G4X0_9FIRM|nr:zf-HC2 domain-containing protein [Desulfuribacillus alkaliarsenatis]OEF98145.1 hypothetical protein BHF68_00175 [Desulfuribacillus alkaliarsenatis]